MTVGVQITFKHCYIYFYFWTEKQHKNKKDLETIIFRYKEYRSITKYVGTITNLFNIKQCEAQKTAIKTSILVRFNIVA